MPATAVPPVEPASPDVPLARLEEDFIALAEETITFDEDAPAVEPNVDPSVVPQAAPPVGVPEGQLPPGAPVQQAVADNSGLIGGYKGPELSSVAGAGEQTADDPFGLNITENAPPGGDKEPVNWARSWRYSSWWNTTMMVVGIVILVIGVGAAVYFGLIRKGGPGGAPAESLREYVEGTVANDANEVNRVSSGNSNLGENIRTLLKGYEKYGIMTLKGFSTKTITADKSSAKLQITKFDVEMSDEKGNSETISVLDITKPFALAQSNPTIELIQVNGKWYVKG